MELHVYLRARFKLYFFVECLYQPNSTSLTLLASPKPKRVDRRSTRSFYLWGAFCSISSAVGQWIGKEVGSQIQGQPVSLGICKNDSRFTFFSPSVLKLHAAGRGSQQPANTKKVKKVKLESIF